MMVNSYIVSIRIQYDSGLKWKLSEALSHMTLIVELHHRHYVTLLNLFQTADKAMAGH